MGRDLVSAPYGRFYYIAHYLSEAGHDVELILFSYLKNENETVKIGKLTLNSLSLLPNPATTLLKACKEIENSSPDWIFGFSDTYYGILAQFLAKKLKKKSLIDAYDNYESYISFLKPLHWLWRRAMRNADIVTCAGRSLKDLFDQYREKEKSVIVPMSVDPARFRPMVKEHARKKLGLPGDKIIIGFHGSISYSRDIEILFRAFGNIRQALPACKLILIGKKADKIKLPESVDYKGYLPDQQVPLYINSVDVMAITLKDSLFGHYSYPIKLYESMACNVPVVVTRTRSTEWIMRGYEDCLVSPGNAEELSERLLKKIRSPRVNYPPQPDWRTNTEIILDRINL